MSKCPTNKIRHMPWYPRIYTAEITNGENTFGYSQQHKKLEAASISSLYALHVYRQALIRYLPKW